MRKSWSLFALFLLLASPVMANDVAEKYVPDAQIVGTGRLSVVFWSVYDATLYAPKGQWNADAPYALSIQYLLEIEGKDIADRSAEEIRKQGFSDEEMLTQWQTQMQDLFPNVKEGTELTAVLNPQKSTDFYFDGQFIGSIKDPDFGGHFFNIWLSEKTSEPALRKKLLGLL
jgi:hypothetical protein